MSVTNVGNDGGQIVPMLAQLGHRTGRRPEQYLVDGGFAKHDDIDTLDSRGVTSSVRCPNRAKKASTHTRVDPMTPTRPQLGAHAWPPTMRSRWAHRIVCIGRTPDDVRVGPTAELLVPEVIESAFDVRAQWGERLVFSPR